MANAPEGMPIQKIEGWAEEQMRKDYRLKTIDRH